jgi:hypothetical protein
VERLRIPEWVEAPTAPVLAARTTEFFPGGRDNILTFFNAQTGERYDIPFVDGRRPEFRWDWQGNALVIAVEYGNWRGLETIDVATGQVTWTPADATPTPIASDVISITREAVSSDGAYLVQMPYQYDGTVHLGQVTLKAINSGREVPLTDPFNGQYHDSNSAQWSPDNRFVAVERLDFRERGEAIGTGLTIYNRSGTVVRTLEGILYVVGWSPDSESIMFGQRDGKGSHPCIITVIDGTIDCLPAFSEWRDGTDFRTGLFKWLPEGQHISWLYWRLQPAATGLCILNLNTGVVTCPIQTELVEPKDASDFLSYITYYDWSPDGLFLSLYVSDSHFESDDRSGTELIVTDREGQVVYHLGHAAFRGALWRPKP